MFFSLSLELLFSVVLLNQHAVGSTSTFILEALYLTSAKCFHCFWFGSQALDGLVGSFSSLVEGLSQHPSTSSFVSGKLSSLEFFFKFISGSNSPREAVVVDSDGVFVVQVESFSSFVLLDYQTFFDFWAVEISLKKFELDTQMSPHSLEVWEVVKLAIQHAEHMGELHGLGEIESSSKVEEGSKDEWIHNSWKERRDNVASKT